MSLVKVKLKIELFMYEEKATSRVTLKAHGRTDVCHDREINTASLEKFKALPKNSVTVLRVLDKALVILKTGCR